MIIDITTIINVICFENFSILIVNGDFVSSVDVTFCAILPTSVLIPVDKTITIALPVKTDVPAYTIVEFESFDIFDTSYVLETPMLSPVSIDSSTVKLLQLIILASAGICEPDSNTTISPGTTFADSISCCLLSLITLTLNLIKFFNASEFFDLEKKPMLFS